MIRKIGINEISEVFEFEIVGKKNVIIEGLNLCDCFSAFPAIMAYADNEQYVDVIAQNPAIKSVLLDYKYYEMYRQIGEKKEITFLLSEIPEETFYKIHQWLIRNTDFYNTDMNAYIGSSCNIHPTAVIEKGTYIGNHVIVGANTVIRKGSKIGNNVMIGCNSIIGSEGFQIININGKPEHIEHVGGVKIGDNVFIGDNNAICNALFEGDTFIGNDVKIDNLVHIAHNCYIGEGAVITAGCMLCGSTRVEEGCWIGVNSSILNKVVLRENTLVGIGSVVTRDTKRKSLVYGSPAKEK